MSQRNKLLEHQNDFDRYFAQADSALSSLISAENLEEMNGRDIMNVLWLIQDRLGDLNQAHQAVYARAATPAEFQAE